MSYLTYTKKFQQDVINAKELNISVKNICLQFNISVYTLYKILHINNKMPIPIQVSVDEVSEKGVEHRGLSSNNNNPHERPASTWRNYRIKNKIKIKR